MKYKQLFYVSLTALTLMACQSNNVEETSAVPAPESLVECPSSSMSPPVQDIWQLEPMLIKDGLIKESMDKEAREQIIREYIAKKNSQYNQCDKSKKKSK